MDSSRPLTIILLLSITFHEGSCLYFSHQSGLVLKSSFYSRNATVYYVKALLNEGETGEIKYAIFLLSPPKKNLVRLGIDDSGRLFFKSEEKEIKESLKLKRKVYNFSVEAHLNNENKDQVAQSAINISLSIRNDEQSQTLIKDCPLTKRELCFGAISNTTVSLRVMENNGEEELLYLGFQQSHCVSHKINYSLEWDGSTSELKGMRIKAMENGHVLVSEPKLDRETIESYKFTLTCILSSAGQDSLKEVINLSLDVLDQDDNLPIKYTKEDIIYFQLDEEDNLHKNGMERLHPEYGHHKDLLFQDSDTQEVNNYTLKVHNDTRNLLDFNKYNKGISQWNEDGFPSATHYQIKIHRSKKFSRPDAIDKDEHYCVLVTLLDNSYIFSKDEFPGVNVTICLYSGTREIISKINGSEMLSQEDLDGIFENPTLEANLTRMATVLSRVLEPFSDLVLDKSEMQKVPELDFRIDNCRAFQSTYDEVDCTEEFENPFNITPHAAIIYLATTTGAIQNEKVEKLVLTLSWKAGVDDSIRSGNNFTIYLEGGGEPGRAPACEESCAQQITQEDCEHSCGLGSPGSCSWRNGPRNETGGIPFMTCSANLVTCPDGTCDELEALDPALCPQDCTSRLSGFGHLKKRIDGRSHGIEFGDGICSCSKPDPFKVGSCDCSKIRVLFSENTSTPRMEMPNVPEIGKEYEEHCGESCVALFIIGFITLTLLVTLIICTMRRKTNAAKTLSNNDSGIDLFPITARPSESGFVGNTTKYDVTKINALQMIDPAWEIPRASLHLQDLLGEGEFGRVHKALACDAIGHQGERIEVALKALKENNSENGKSSYSEFIAEYSLLKQVDNPNVIKLLGACTEHGGPWYLVLEYAEFGSLRGFLRKSRRLPVDSSGCGKTDPAFDAVENYVVTSADILGFSWQIAKGMNYLSEIKMVHRDLAARNVLLTKDRVCKISDFGLTRDIYIDDTYQKKSKDKVPVKWLAPECLSDELYTVKSDVWAFGITLWEIVNLGISPYPGVSNENLFNLIRNGYRMPMPKNCSPELYNIMRHCWEFQPYQRPHFKHLVLALSRLMEESVDYLSFDTTVVSNPGYRCIDFEKEALLNRNFQSNHDSREDSSFVEDFENGGVSYEPQEFYPRTYVNQVTHNDEETLIPSQPVVQSNSFYEIPIKP